MLSKFSYPILCTDKFEASVAFYEDHFSFVPAFEMDGFVIMKREDWDDMYLALIDSNHEVLPEAYKRSTQGMILNYPVEDAQVAYQQNYIDGLSVLSEPQTVLCGRKHYFVEDPNGILIDVAEEVDIESLICEENQDSFRVMACA